MRWLDDLFDKTKHLIQDTNLRNSSGTEIDFATQTTLAAVLAKIIAAPATEAKQDTLIAKDFATQTTLAALLAKVIAAPATEAKQDSVITALGLLGTEAKLEAVRALLAGTLTTQLTGSIPAGTALVGKVGIDQTTPGTTNKVVAELSERTIVLAYIFNAVAITDTNTRTQDISISAYKKITVSCANTLNQALTVNLRYNGAPLYQWDGANFTLASMTIPANTEKSMILNTRYTLINDIVGSTFGLAAVASIAPASGSFTATIQGVVN